MKLAIFIAMLLILGFQSFGQIKLTGIVTDADNNQPVPYASIGVTTTPDGTVADSSGLYSILLNNQVTDNDTLKFSSIGYESKAFLIGELKEQAKNEVLAITLKQSVKQLQQVSIVSKKPHVKIEGYDKNSKLFGLAFDASGVGSQAGVVIPITHPQTNLENVSFYIIQNPFKRMLFRVNIYEMVNDKPGNSILSDNILIHVDNYQTGKLIFDLSRYNIYSDKDVLISLEWIEVQPSSNAKIAVAASPFGHTFYRAASQSAWVRKSNGVGISAKTNY